MAGNALVELLLTEFCGCTMDDPEAGDYIAAMEGLVAAMRAHPMKVWNAMPHGESLEVDPNTGEPLGPPYCQICSEVTGNYAPWPCRFAPQREPVKVADDEEPF